MKISIYMAMIGIVFFLSTALTGCKDDNIPSEFFLINIWKLCRNIRLIFLLMLLLLLK